jgi:hypothetical protein
MLKFKVVTVRSDLAEWFERLKANVKVATVLAVLKIVTVQKMFNCSVSCSILGFAKLFEVANQDQDPPRQNYGPTGSGFRHKTVALWFLDCLVYYLGNSDKRIKNELPWYKYIKDKRI